MNSRWNFLKRSWTDDLTESGDKTGQNPARGFYRVYTYDITAKEAEEDWVWSLQKDERLALVLLDIGKCADRALSKQELAKAARIFSLFRAHRMQMLVRVVYDRSGHGMESEPRTIEQVLRHMKQLAPLFVQFAADIFTIQGLFIGSWGEMHDSHFLEKKQLRMLYETLRETTQERVCISVRKPQYQRMLCDAKGRICTGLYNDAILGSETDMGTYGWIDDRTNREIMWTPEAELEFIEKQAADTPCGGEVLAGALQLPFAQAVDRMRRMQLTYLNRVHEPIVWQTWHQVRCGLQDGHAYGQWSCLDYMQAYLGYRYVLEDVVFLKDRGKNEKIQISIKNCGFACCYDILRIVLFVGNVKKQIAFDGKTLTAGGLHRLEFEIKDVLQRQTSGDRLGVSMAMYHEKTGLPIFVANQFSDERKWEKYRSNNSRAEEIVLGVLLMEKDAAS